MVPVLLVLFLCFCSQIISCQPALLKKKQSIIVIKHINDYSDTDHTLIVNGNTHIKNVYLKGDLILEGDGRVELQDVTARGITYNDNRISVIRSSRCKIGWITIVPYESTK